MSLGDSIRAVLLADPAVPAVEYRGRWFSRADLGAAAERIESLALRAGAPSAAPLALVARNRPGHVAAVIGALAAGRCFSMLYSAQAASRLADEVRGLRPPVLVADAEDWRPEAIEAARQVGAIGVSLSIAAGLVVAPVAGLGEPGPGPHHRVAADTVAELLSSGTTGAPKRVPLSRRAMEGAVADNAALYGAVPKVNGRAEPGAAPKPTIVIHPLGNISGVTYLVPLAFSGQPLVLLEKFALDEWLAAVARHRPLRGALPPAAIRMILDAQIPREALAGLLAIGSGGAGLEPELQDAFESRYGILVLPGYGATEFCGVIANWTPELRQEFAGQKRGSLGRVRPGVRLRIVDPDAPAQAPGALAAGEIGLLEAQVDRMGPDWIRTTDLASVDADGFLTLHGRADQAINRGGFKVVPQLVTNALCQHPAVFEAAVIGVRDARLGEVPVAAVETRPGASTDEAELLSFARQKLLSYQVPVRIHVLEVLPRTLSMKVDLAALRARIAANETSG